MFLGDNWETIDDLCFLVKATFGFSAQTYDKSIEAFLHPHIVALLEVAEIDVLLDIILEVVLRELVKAGSHLRGFDCDGSSFGRSRGLSEQSRRRPRSSVPVNIRWRGRRLWTLQTEGQDFSSHVRIVELRASHIRVQCCAVAIAASALLIEPQPAQGC